MSINENLKELSVSESEALFNTYNNYYNSISDSSGDDNSPIILYKIKEINDKFMLNFPKKIIEHNIDESLSDGEILSIKTKID